MSPSLIIEVTGIPSFPRVSGDEPSNVLPFSSPASFSPREWG